MKSDATPPTVLTVSIKGPGGTGRIEDSFDSAAEAGRIYSQIYDILSKRWAATQK